MPVKINLDYEDTPYERYEYRDLTVNVELTDKDFDPDHKEYDF